MMPTPCDLFRLDDAGCWHSCVWAKDFLRNYMAALQIMISGTFMEGSRAFNKSTQFVVAQI